MPYVTEFNESRIISDLTTEIKKELTSKDIYHKDIPFLNSLEISRLYDYKRFCQGDIDVDSVYKRAQIIDRKKYVFEGNKPSYHKSNNCKFLHSRFKNIELPEEVQNWDSSEIDEYRNWFKKEIQEIDNDELIASKIKERWGIEYNVVRADFKNSGSIYIENLLLNNIEKRIDSLLKAQKDFYKQNQYFLVKFSKLTFYAFKAIPIPNNSTGLSDSELKQKLAYYHNLFKEPVIHYLKEYYKIKFSTEIVFEEKLLDSLGFKKCWFCYGDFKILELNNSENEEKKEKTALDLFLNNRFAKKLCRVPTELNAYQSIINTDYLEFYYFCKLMAINEYIEINFKKYREVIIEYIIDDNIFYEKAYFDEELNNLRADQLIIFNGYLIYTRFKRNNHKDFWRELFNFDYEHSTNYY